MCACLDTSGGIADGAAAPLRHPLASLAGAETGTHRTQRTRAGKSEGKRGFAADPLGEAPAAFAFLRYFQLFPSCRLRQFRCESNGLRRYLAQLFAVPPDVEVACYEQPYIPAGAVIHPAENILAANVAFDKPV